jgi:hypothetical protein
MISVIICFIIDISGIIENIEWYLGKWLGGKVIIPKPFSCSLCLTFWVGLIWLIVQGEVTLFNIMAVCLLSALTEQITNTITLFKQLIARLQDAIQDLITKLQ